MAERLQGKRIFITGAAAGIGRACAEVFAEHGAKLVLFDRADGVVDVANAIEASGGRAVSIVGGVDDEVAVADAIERCTDELGGIDCVVANAGIVGAIESVLDLSADDWRDVFEVNLLGAFLCLKYGGRKMVDSGGGSIVCTASVAGMRAGAGPAQYSASKAGIISLVQNAAFQLAGTGVRVNAVCPGLIETSMTQFIFDGARAAGKTSKVGQLNPTRRPGQPREIAQVALFLASDESSYVNGHALVADGGLSAAHPHMRGSVI